MKYYTLTEIELRGNGEYGDEFDSYAGFDFEKIMEAYSNVRSNDKYALEIRAYELPNDIDVNDEDEISNAIVECAGYDVLNEGDDFNAIKALRVITKMSQNEFANYFEIPAASLRNWEQGRTACPNYLVKLIQDKLKTDNKI